TDGLGYVLDLRGRRLSGAAPQCVARTAFRASGIAERPWPHGPWDLRPSTFDPLRDAIGAGGREGEAVADPVLGDDVLRRGRVLLDLAAQAPDVELEVLGVADVLRAPDPLEEPLVRVDLAGVVGRDEGEAPLGAA